MISQIRRTTAFGVEEERKLEWGGGKGTGRPGRGNDGDSVSL